MHLPGVIYIKLEITPAAFGDFRGRDLGVVKKNCVAEQQVGNTVTGLLTAALNRCLLITTACANARLILEIVTEESPEFQVVRSLNQGEVVFPDIEIFAILPRSLVPDVCITAGAPEERRYRASNVSVRFREDRRNGGSDLVFECLAVRRRGDDDVVAGDRKLKFVDGFRRQSVRQLNCKTMAGLTPVRRQRWIWRVSPEITCRAQMRPFLVDITHHQIHPVSDINVTADQILAGVDRLNC